MPDRRCASSTGTVNMGFGYLALHSGSWAGAFPCMDVALVELYIEASVHSSPNPGEATISWLQVCVLASVMLLSRCGAPMIAIVLFRFDTMGVQGKDFKADLLGPNSKPSKGLRKANLSPRTKALLEEVALSEQVQYPHPSSWLP